VADKDYNISGYTALYFAAHMINLEWVQHRSGVHQLFPSSTAIRDEDDNLLVTSYAVLRPDREWAVMLVNRDQWSAHPIRVVFEGGAGKMRRVFSGPVRVVTFGSGQYEWKNDGPNSHADPDGPPLGQSVLADSQTIFTLPEASITVLRGKLKVLR
jgi:hypothetical protein